MIRQKNQEEYEKTSTRDTNKKRRNRDIDSSLPYSSLSWTDLEPILSIEDFNLEASAVPQKVVEELRDRLMQVCKLYGDVYSGKEGKRCGRKERACARSLRVCVEAWQEACIHPLSDVEGLEQTLRIVTNYLEWVFISDDDEKIRRMNTTLKVYGAVPSTEELREIVGIICGLLANST
ncbi:hypothetical protein Plhal304r1_c017g0062351 [Plasmopara halstedii]